MHRLDGVLTVSELRGVVFGLEEMARLRSAERTIRRHRRHGSPHSDIPALPSNPRTADNLKIYFVSHLGLDGQLVSSTSASFYGAPEQAFELTESGYEMVAILLDEAWPNWRNPSSSPPRAETYRSISDYFSDGVGQPCPDSLIGRDARASGRATARLSAGIVDHYDLEQLKELPHREFEEGRKRLVQHASVESVRNSALVAHAKRGSKSKYGRLFCEICAFDFESVYGARGRDYIEAHHKVPIAQIDASVKLTVADLLMVCSNCHRMLHRPPWATAEEIRSKIAPPRRS